MKEIVYFLEDSLNLDNIIVAINEKNNIIFVSLDNTKEDNIYNLKKEYPDSHLLEGVLNDHIREVFAYIKNPTIKKNFHLEFSGTDLQKQVWNELLNIPSGKTLTYSELAEKLNKPKSVRAIATACGKNKIAVLVPCHRVIAKNGELSGFKWGITRKKTLLEIEKENKIY